MLGLPAPYRNPRQVALHSNRSTLLGGSRLAAGSSSFTILTILHFLPRTIAYTATKQVHQQTSDRSDPHNGWLEYGLGLPS